MVRSFRRAAIGELMIGGDGVAVGYWDMAALTSERFPADRFRDAPGAKLYRTGDLVRMRQDGEFQYLGRTDQQIKLRGFRIELGEIEAVLLRHDAVRHAIAITGESASGETAIFAYVELHGDAAARRQQIVEALRADVAAMLPGYMRPRDIIVLDAIPLLPNGKIDRKALPLPGPEEQAERARLQPLDDLETRLAQIWCEILGVKSVDASADFFELGGHSLLAARLLARVEAAFGHRISMSALFESPGFTAFANLLRSPRQQDFDFREVVRMGSRHAERTIFAINNTGIFLTLSQRLNESLSITALQLFDPSIERDKLPVTIEETAGQYVRLIREIQPTGPYALVGWCNGGTLAFETARQLLGGWRGCIARLPDRHMDSRLFQTSWLASIETGGLHLSLAVDPGRLGHGAVRAKVLVGLHRRSQHGAPFLPSRSGRRGRSPNLPMLRRKLTTIGCSIIQPQC